MRLLVSVAFCVFPVFSAGSDSLATHIQASPAQTGVTLVRTIALNRAHFDTLQDPYSHSQARYKGPKPKEGNVFLRIELSLQDSTEISFEATEVALVDTLGHRYTPNHIAFTSRVENREGYAARVKEEYGEFLADGGSFGVGFQGEDSVATYFFPSQTFWPPLALDLAGHRVNRLMFEYEVPESGGGYVLSLGEAGSMLVPGASPSGDVRAP